MTYWLNTLFPTAIFHTVALFHCHCQNKILHHTQRAVKEAEEHQLWAQGTGHRAQGYRCGRIFPPARKSSLSRGRDLRNFFICNEIYCILVHSWLRKWAAAEVSCNGEKSCQRASSHCLETLIVTTTLRRQTVESVRRHRKSAFVGNVVCNLHL